MKEKTIPIDIETYENLVQISKYGFYVSFVNSVLMILVSILTKSIEQFQLGPYEIAHIIDIWPLHLSVFFHLISILAFKITWSRILQADKDQVFRKLKEERPSEMNSQIGRDFSKQSYMEVLEPMGSGSNQWGFFWLVGLALSLPAILFGGLSTFFSCLLPRMSSISEPYVILCIAAIVSQVVMLRITVEGLFTMPTLLQRSVGTEWPEQFKETLGWRLKKKSAEKQITDVDKSPMPWRIKMRLWRRTTMYVNLPAKEATERIAEYLRSSNTTIVSRDTYKIVADHGKLIAWEPKENKKRISVEAVRSDETSSKISVDIRFSLVDRLLTLFFYFLIASIAIISFQFDPLLGAIISSFFILTLSPVILWDFFEKDSIVRGLWYEFYQTKVLDIEELEISSRSNKTIEKLTRLGIESFTRLDNLFRIAFGAGIVRSQDFPFMPMYLFRDYRSNLNKYGKSAHILGNEDGKYDFADTTIREPSEIRIKKSKDFCKVEYIPNEENIAENIKDPFEILEDTRIIGRPSALPSLGPWASIIMIALGILLFIASFEGADWIVSKTLFVYIMGIGLWIVAGTALILLFENSSSLLYTPDYLQAILALGIFPVISYLLYLFIPEGSYSFRVGMYLWSFAAIVFGITVAPHTAGKPFSRALYFYVKNQTSKYYAFKEKKRKDAPYWLEADFYWVFRFVLRWFWEISLPPHRDFERLEVWVNAQSGKPEWVVTDYHYRELWYRVSSDSSDIIFWWDSNFHSFHPIVEGELVQLFRGIKQSKGVFGSKLDMRYRKKMYEIFERISSIHPIEEVRPFFNGLEKLGAKKCAKLPWLYWRYTFGAYPKTKHERWKKYASESEGHGAALPEEQFSSRAQNKLLARARA